MELGSGAPDRYKKITFWKEAIDELLVKVFIESQPNLGGHLKTGQLGSLQNRPVEAVI
jgi:hypothetical protein